MHSEKSDRQAIRRQRCPKPPPRAGDRGTVLGLREVRLEVERFLVADVGIDIGNAQHHRADGHVRAQHPVGVLARGRDRGAVGAKAGVAVRIATCAFSVTGVLGIAALASVQT
jgi:hypothetical protein